MIQMEESQRTWQAFPSRLLFGLVHAILPALGNSKGPCARLYLYSGASAYKIRTMTAPELFYTIRKLETMDNKESKQADAFLAAAFENDKFTDVATGGDRAIFGPFWRSLMVAGLHGGEVYVAEHATEKVIIAAAVWYGPGRALYDSSDQREKAWPICADRFRPEITKWWETYLLPKYASFCEEAFGEGVKLASWHLQAFAVEPKFQHKGIARTLIEKMKQKACMDGIPLTLEATADYNVDIYKRLGFSVKGETSSSISRPLPSHQSNIQLIDAEQFFNIDIATICKRWPKTAIISSLTLPTLFEHDSTLLPSTWMSNIVQQCLNLQPVPGLSFAFSIFQSIVLHVEEAQASQEQLNSLAQSVAILLQTLNKQFHAGKLGESAASTELADLNTLLQDISAFVRKHASLSFFQILFVKAQTVASIENYQARLTATIAAFQISALVNIQQWQERNDKARAKDRRSLNLRLNQLAADNLRLMEVLDIKKNSPTALMVSLHRRIEEKQGEKEDLQFFTHSLRCLTRVSGQQVDIKPWTISPYDVEFGPLIGSGGFGKVYRGTWNKMEVALKVMKNSEDITPRAAAVRREVDTWSKLRHPHILQFLGANILNEEPFIVMPLIKNGNARDYIDEHPECDCLKLIHQISLGLVYLHSNHVIHGDLKGVNVLIDEGERALLCDFGLARIKADINSRSTGDTSGFMGSQNWMAPELFQGRSLKVECDVYSFGMTIYELYARDIPLGNLAPGILRQVVVQNHVRPDRPDARDAPQLSDEVWTIAQRCWNSDPAARPRATSLCEELAALLSRPSRARPARAAPPPPQAMPTPQFSPTAPQLALTPPSAAQHAPHPLRPARQSSATSSKVPPNILLWNQHPSNASSSTSTVSLASSSKSGGPPQYRNETPTQRSHERPAQTSPTSLSPSPIVSSGSSTSSIKPASRIGTFFRNTAMDKPYKRFVTMRNPARVTCLVQSPDGNELIAGLATGYFECWSASDGTLLHPASESICRPFIGGRLSCIAYSRAPLRGRDTTATAIYVVGSESGVVAHHPAMGGFTRTFNDNSSPIVCIDANSKRMATLTRSHEVVSWGVSEHKQHKARIRRLHRISPAACTCGAFSPDGTRVVSGTSSGMLLLSDPASGKLVGQPLTLPGAGVRALAFSPDGNKLLASYGTGDIRLWDISSGKSKIIEPAGTAMPPPSRQIPVAFSPDGSRIAIPVFTGGPPATKVVRVLDSGSGKVLANAVLDGCPEEDVQTIHISITNKRLILSFVDVPEVKMFIWE
ncbi:unnamed protein product [Cyclocybe aegerita]|uniref:Uncharacterized protein n=1 Tax=Cyclocybe aegerita TaxID=1973307 RepID=A0A8S0Y0B2_CYCAE|nr:unnamed protein product [Cyclocybe aegerita]